MGFDIEAARKAGYSDEEIKKYVSDNDMSWGEVLKESAKNIIPDIGRTAVEMVAPLLDPKGTAVAVKNLIIGTAQKLYPGEQAFEKYPDAVWEQLASEYGTVDALKETISKRPAKVLLDISSAATGAGGLVRGAGKVAGLANVAKAGEKIQRVGAVTEPISAIKSAVSQAGKIVKPDLPRELYEKAAKFSKTLPVGERMKRADTALKHNLLPNYKGVEKAFEKIWALKEKVDGKVADLTMKGKRIKSTDLLKGTDRLRREYSHGMAKTNIASIDKIIDDVWYGVEDLQKNGTLSPTEVNKIKRKLYDEVNYINKKRSTPAKEATQKAIAKGAKESVAKLDDTITPLNKEMGDLVGLVESLPQAASRIADRDIIGIGLPIKVAAGSTLPGGQVAGAALGLLDTPQIKARIARGLHNAQTPGRILPQTRQALYQTQQAKDALLKKGLLNR